MEIRVHNSKSAKTTSKPEFRFVPIIPPMLELLTRLKEDNARRSSNADNIPLPLAHETIVARSPTHASTIPTLAPVDIPLAWHLHKTAPVSYRHAVWLRQRSASQRAPPACFPPPDMSGNAPIPGYFK
jgi:hypothetical protein